MTDAKKTGSSSKEGATGTSNNESDDAAETKSEKSGNNQPNAAGAQSTTAKTEDAEKLLKADHRKVEQLFQQYKSAKDDTDKKAELAQQICNELIVHTKLEEEIFYPACREKDVEDDSLDEAQVEHDGAKVMIAELIEGSPDDDYYDAKVTVLSEYIKHHVGEEEKASDGIFAKARKAGVDMNALGSRIQARKTELLGQIDTLGSKPPKPKSLDLSSIASTGRNQETYAMARNSNNRDRDEQGRFMSEDDDDYRGGRSSSRGGYSSRSRDDDEDYRGSSRRSSGSNDRERDDQGRFMSDDDNRGGRSSSRGGYSSRSRDDDDYRSGNGGRSGSNYRERDEQGRFMSDDDDERGGRSSSRGGYSSRGSSRYDEDDDRGGRGGGSSRGGRGQGHGGWFGDPEGHSEAAERGWEGRSSSRGGSSSRSSSRYDDDDDRGGRSMSSSRGGRGGQGHGGWFGDSEGHSEAAERGWEHRNAGRNGSSSRRSSRDDDDDRGSRSMSSSRGGRGGQGHGGWFGDPEGHSQAAKRGWEDR